MVYVPDDLQEDLDLLKRIRASGRCYDIICYDSKEENERKESSKENKEKEERPNPNPKEKIYKKDFSKCTIPTLEDVKEYHEKLGEGSYRGK